MKIERFNVALTSSDKFIELQPDPEGSLCFASEVVKLEAKCVELETKGAELLEALSCLTAVVGLTPIKGNLEALQEAYDMARAAIAKAKGEVMP